MTTQDSFYRELGRRVYRARVDNGLTQDELAKLVRLSRTSITNIEKGRQKLLAHTVADLAKALHIPCTNLYPSVQEQPDAVDNIDVYLKGAPAAVRQFAKSALSRSQARKT